MREQRAYAIARPVGWPQIRSGEPRARASKVPRRYAPEAVMWEEKEEWEIRDEMERRLRVRGWLDPVPVVVPFVENPRNQEPGVLMKKFIAVLIASLAPLAFAAPAAAQTGALVSLTVQYQQNSLPIIGRTTTLVLAGIPCGQPQMPGLPGTPAIVSTATLIWQDPANASLICVAVQPPAASIFLLPLGANYSATATFTNDAGMTSPPSVVSNSFSRAAPILPPLAPSGFQVRP